MMSIRAAEWGDKEIKRLVFEVELDKPVVGNFNAYLSNELSIGFFISTNLGGMKYRISYNGVILATIQFYIVNSYACKVTMDSSELSKGLLVPFRELKLAILKYVKDMGISVDEINFVE